MSRLGLALIAVWTASVFLSPSASAHNGVGAAFKGHPGNYIVWAYDGDPLSKKSLEYRLIVLNRHTQEPVYNVHVAVTATWPGKPSAVATVTTFGNVFFYDLPNPYPGDWLMHLTLSGSLGTAKAVYKMHGAAPPTPPLVVPVEPGSPPWPAIVGGRTAAVAAATGGLVWWRRRRTAAARAGSAADTRSRRPENAAAPLHHR